MGDRLSRRLVERAMREVGIRVQPAFDTLPEAAAAFAGIYELLELIQQRGPFHAAMGTARCARCGRLLRNVYGDASRPLGRICFRKEYSI